MRQEIRARYADNTMMLSLLNAVGLLFLAMFGISRVWDSGLWAVLIAAAFALVPIGLSWLYVATATIWWDDDRIGYRWLFRSSHVPREKVHKLLGGMGRISFAGSDGRLLMVAGRFMNDDQLRDLARRLGIKLEGLGRWLGPLET